jgi:hypothetical protein
MKSRHYFYFILLFLFQACFTGGLVGAEEKKVYIHPSFELCLKLYPRNKEIVNPMVPRISAKSGFNLYREGKAIFFYAGMQKLNMIPGAIMINDVNGLIENPPIKFLKGHENKLFVIYCH